MLKKVIERHILSGGGMPLVQYISTCLTDPNHGYYMKKNPLGKARDLVTAPELTQMFGEMIGGWVVDVWQQMDRPQDIQLVELGPGRGSMMLDILRVLRMFSGLSDLGIHMVEISPALTKIQQSRLSGLPVEWHQNIDTVLTQIKGLPAIFMANEFFDVLPIQQFIRTECGWRQMLVDAKNGTFTLVPDALPTCVAIPPYHYYPQGTIYELCPLGLEITSKIGHHIKTYGGGILVIDYGYEYGVGNTLRAVQGHKKISIFEAPGIGNFTAHVRFSDLRYALESQGLKEVFYLTQQDFLKALGIEGRAQALKSLTTKVKQQAIDLVVDRLIGDQNPEYNMGYIFKVLGAVNLYGKE